MSRRDAIRMTDAEIADFLDSARTITIVSQGPGGYPHPMPMWFVRDPDGTIRMTTYRSSQKIKNLQRDSRVALMADSGTTYEELRGVVIYGHAELLDDPVLIVDTIQRAARVASTEETAVSGAMTSAATKRIVVRVRPERVVSWDHRTLGGTY